MTTNEALTLVLSDLAGALLGTVFFGGLWWTVRRGVSSKRPALFFACSLTLRMSTVVVGFYVVSSGHWQRLMACLLGFVMASGFTARLVRPSGGDPSPAGQEARDAPYPR